MRRPTRTTTFALAGLLALGSTTACSEGAEDTGGVEREGEGDLEGNPDGEAEEGESEGQVDDEGEDD